MNLIVMMTLMLYSRTSFSWMGHSLATAIAIKNLPESKDQVKVESLESFLSDTQKNLPELLKDEEAYAKKNIPNYPERPASLEFKDHQTPTTVVKNFIQALRINPNSKFALFLKQRALPDEGLMLLLRENVTLTPNALSTSEVFVKINEGDSVAASAVFSTASDEPDYGLDLNLWTDNGTEFGKSYGFGAQPFGNPKLEFSSQIPFHIGYFHESKFLYKAASFLNKTFPEYRIHLFFTLARYAFSTGHPYWGYRFLGWGVHYIQDLTQPYHSTAVPGASTIKLLWVNFLDKIGRHGPKLNLIQLISDQHLALENYSYKLLKEIEQTNNPDHPLIKALSRFENDKSLPVYTDFYPRNIISLESNKMADYTNGQLELYLKDPSETNRKIMADLNQKLLTNFALHTRKFFQAGLSTKK